MWVKQCHRPPITGNGKHYIPPIKIVIWVPPIFAIKRFYMVEVYYPICGIYRLLCFIYQPYTIYPISTILYRFCLNIIWLIMMIYVKPLFINVFVSFIRKNNVNMGISWCRTSQQHSTTIKCLIIWVTNG